MDKRNGTLFRAFRSRKIALFAALTLAMTLMIGTAVSDASTYFYFKTPSSGKTYTAGSKIPVSMYAGGVRTYTKMDAWGNPESTTYEEMPATLKVFKGDTELYSQEYKYTEPTTISTQFIPKATGTLTLRYYARSGGLTDDSQTLQDTVKIKVKKMKAAAVRNVKPVITVDRTAKKKAVITCDGAYGYGLKVYRSTSRKGTYKLIKTLKAGKLSFTDTSVAASKVYYYKVRIFAKSGSKTYLSKKSAAVKAAKYVPSTDTSALHVIVKNTSGGVKISWTKNSKAGYYLVSRGTSSDGSGDVITCNGDNELEWLDKEAAKGKTYYYVVTAWYGNDEKPLVKSKPVKIKVS